MLSSDFRLGHLYLVSTVYTVSRIFLLSVCFFSLNSYGSVNYTDERHRRRYEVT